MLPKEFFVPWEEIDPELKHGGAPGELDQFVGPRLGDNPKTTNCDMFQIFSIANEVAASLSMLPEGNMEGPPTKNTVEATLRAINWYVERVKDRTVASSTKLFQWTHATPPFIDFKMRPIRYPLRNLFLHQAVYHWLGTQVEIAEMNSNALHANMDPSSSVRTLAPIVHLKTTIMLDWFDLEIKGDVSAMEIAEMFAGMEIPGPTIVPTDETHPLPNPDDVVKALEGADVLQWFPNKEQWQVFGKKRDAMYKAENVWQPEGSFRTTEDVAPETPVTSADAQAEIG